MTQQIEPTHESPSAEADDAMELRRFLAKHDAACPSCHYSLKGLTGDRCPECNQQLLLSVQLVEARLAAYVAGLIGLAGAAGFWSVVACFVGYEIVTRSSRYGFGYEEKIISAVVLTGCVLAGVSLGAWVRAGRRLRRQSSSRQWMLAILAWAAMIVYGSVAWIVLDTQLR